MKKKAVKRKIRLDIKSNAGGTGKTTLVTHLAYMLGAKGYSVTVIELDPLGSLKIFTGAFSKNQDPPPEQTLAAVLRDDFKGDYPLFPIWDNKVKNVNVILGGAPLEESIQKVYSHSRKYYLLQDRLEDYPIESDIIILDNPGGLEPMGMLALAAATHILVVMQLEYKALYGAASLINWFYDKINELRLRPEPEILGFVPSQVNVKKIAAHRNIGAEMPNQLQEIGISCFPPIRESNQFINASGVGLPIHLFAPTCEAIKDFNPIVAKIIELMNQD
ncbi:cobyrinic acid a,c-diamide synthase (plasmid) [Cylindrospermum sp. NIES-4074]|nr:cobyrinic acid a,c-diamide synthase [Cylindrospermum sp. NIES-4074]